MRKRVINHVADTIFWYILYFLPVLAYLFFVISAPFRDITKEEGYTASVEYEVQYTCTIPANSYFVVPDDYYSILSVKNYFFASLNNYYYNEAGDRLFIKYPVLVCSKAYYDNVDDFEHGFGDFKGLPVLVCGADWRDPAVPNNFNKTQVPLTIPLPCPVSSLTSVFQLYYYPLEGYNINFGNVGISKTAYIEGVEYVATELAEGMTYDFKDFVNTMGFEFATDNLIVNTLGDIFGTGGIMPLFDNDTPFIIFAWFIGVYLLHLLVDFILFIPRIAHKWLKDCTGGD